MIKRFSAPWATHPRWLLLILCIALAAVVPAALVAQQPAPPAMAQSASAIRPSSRPRGGSGDAPALAPSNAPSTDVNTPSITLNANEVDLIFTVTDGHGHYVPNLKLNDFALLDDQRAPEKVHSFHQQINLPLRVGILIDASTSIRSRFQFEQQAAIEFLLQVLKSRQDRAFVMGFDVTPDLTADWTNDMDALETGINRLSPGGGTALFDAVYSACRNKLLGRVARPGAGAQSHHPHLRRRRQPEPRLRDRGHQGVRARRDHHLRHQHQLDAQPRPRRQGAQDLSEETGGEVFFPPSIDEMSVQLPEHRHGIAQPVCAHLYSSRLQIRRFVPNHLSLLLRPPLSCASQKRLLCPAGAAISAAHSASISVAWQAAAASARLFHFWTPRRSAAFFFDTAEHSLFSHLTHSLQFAMN